MLDSRARGSCPSPPCRNSILIKHKQVVLNYTSFIVAPLIQGGGHGMKECTFFLRSTGEAQKPFFSRRWVISALSENPSEDGLEKDQDRPS